MLSSKSPKAEVLLLFTARVNFFSESGRLYFPENFPNFPTFVDFGFFGFCGFFGFLGFPDFADFADFADSVDFLIYRFLNRPTFNFVPSRINRKFLEILYLCF
jgi:hypothetical protein